MTGTADTSQDFRIAPAHMKPPYGMQMAAACLNNQLMVFYVDNLAITASTLDLFPDRQHPDRPIDIAGGAAARPEAWKSAALQIRDANGTGHGVPKTYGQFAVAATATDIFVFWNQGASNVLMARMSVEGQGWQGPYTVRIPTSDRGVIEWIPQWGQTPVAATAIGDTTIAAVMTETRYLHDQSGYQSTMAFFDPGDIDDANMQWVARRWEVMKQTAGVQGRSGHYTGLAWFNGMSAPSPQEAPADPPMALWVNGEGLGPNMGFYGLDGGTGLAGTTPLRMAHVQTPAFQGLVRDPAGRMVVFTDPGQAKSVGMLTFAMGVPLGCDTEAPLPQPLSADQVDLSGATRGATAFFHTDMANGTDVAYADGDRPDGRAYPVYRFVFASTGGDLRCRIDRYGTAEVFENRYQGTPEPKAAGTVILRGIVDSPIPIPQANLDALPLADLPETFGAVVYGVGAKRGSQREVSNSWTVGFKSSGEAESGVGAAWDISISGGQGYVRGDGSTISTEKDVTLPTERDPDAYHEGKAAVMPVGKVFYGQIRLNATVFRFRDAAGNLVSDSGATATGEDVGLFTSVTSAFEGGTPTNYFPCFSVRPGELTSYTPKAITARMKALGLFDGDDYIAEVVEPNAARIDAETDGPYLAISWDNSGDVSSAVFEKIATSFKQDSWTLDADVYAGVSFGAGASIFGLGEKEQFKFMFGGTYSHEDKTTTESEDSMSIGLPEGIDLPPVPSDAHKAVRTMTFRLYFLPPPQAGGELKSSHWANELADGLTAVRSGDLGEKNPHWFDPARIDRNSSPWKVMFVLESFELVDGTRYP